MENQYTKYYKNRTIEELQAVVGNPASYEDEARLAAYKSLQQKKVKLSQEQIEDVKFIEDSFKRQIRVREKEVIKEEVQEWYSPTAILGFSVFFSPLFGAILLSYNLKRANKRIQANYVLVLGVVFVIAAIFLVYMGKMNQIISIGLSVIAGLIFIEFFWKKHLGYQTKYKRKPIWKPLIIFLGIVFLLVGIQMAVNPELFQEMLEQQHKAFD